MADDHRTAGSFWDEVTPILREQFGSHSWNTWFASAEPTELGNDHIVLSVPAEIIRRRIIHFFPEISEILESVAGHPMEARIVVINPQKDKKQAQPTLLDLVDPVPTELLSSHTTNNQNTRQQNKSQKQEKKSGKTGDEKIFGDYSGFAKTASSTDTTDTSVVEEKPGPQKTATKAKLNPTTSLPSSPESPSAVGLPVLTYPEPASRQGSFGRGKKSSSKETPKLNEETEPPQSPVRQTNTFETFIIGESNRFAHAAALAVAEAPGESYNPLFIYGGTGLGKTHLLQAIVNMVKRMGNLHTIYTTSEQFTNEFIDMIRADGRKKFQDRYRVTDILLIDDIQFLAGREQTQNEFFHTFNHLYQTNRQIVIASDRSPKEISELGDRLRSRFESGLITDVQPPDLETRIAILRNKSERMQLNVPSDVLEAIARRISDNIRALEGALTKVVAYTKLERTPISSTLAEEILEEMGTATSHFITSDIIVRETAKYYNITLDELLGPSRRRPLVNARQIAMYIHRELTDLSLPRIGDIFGGRDHTTVLHACRKVSDLMAEKRKIFHEVNELQTRIKNASSS